MKRFHLLFEEWPAIVCFKIRDGAKRIVKVKEGKFNPFACASFVLFYFNFANL